MQIREEWIGLKIEIMNSDTMEIEKTGITMVEPEKYWSGSLNDWANGKETNSVLNWWTVLQKSTECALICV